MNHVPLAAQVVLYLLIGLMVLFDLFVLWWQIMVLKGKTMKNPDGSFDSYHEQKSHYGMAVADVFLICPAILVGVLLVLFGSLWVSLGLLCAGLMQLLVSLGQRHDDSHQPSLREAEDLLHVVRNVSVCQSGGPNLHHMDVPLF